MRYVGGKSRIAGWVAEHVLPLGRGRARYVEPFVGSGACFARLAPAFSAAVAADAHPDLVLMWQDVAAGWQPPERVTREEYAALKAAAEPSALRGFVGFGASFGGKWFGGYVDTCWDAYWQRQTKPYLDAARRSILKLAPVFARATVARADYADHAVTADDLVYCDPPYAGTLGYGGTAPFDTAAFWDRAARWSEAGAAVVVSETTAPTGWRVLAERSRKAMLRVAVGTANDVRREALWVRA